MGGDCWGRELQGMAFLSAGSGSATKQKTLCADRFSTPSERKAFERVKLWQVNPVYRVDIPFPHASVPPRYRKRI